MSSWSGCILDSSETCLAPPTQHSLARQLAARSGGLNGCGAASRVLTVHKPDTHRTPPSHYWNSEQIRRGGARIGSPTLSQMTGSHVHRVVAGSSASHNPRTFGASVVAGRASRIGSDLERPERIAELIFGYQSSMAM